MNSIHRYLIPAAALAAAFIGVNARADEDAPKKEMRAMVAPGHGDPGPGLHRERHVVRYPAETESVTFLGVETRPVDPAMSEQLGLPRGSGLIVDHIVPESAAAAALKRYDVLTKLDDQILIDPGQFAVLIRNHREGDEVTLTYLRAGKEGTAKVKLTKHDVPKLSSMPWHDGFLPGPDFNFGREDMDRVLSLMDGKADPLRGRNLGHMGGPGFRKITVNTGNSSMVYSDEKGSVELKTRDGKKEVVAKNAKGDVVFSGPINTPEERKNVPPEVNEKLERLENTQNFTFKTDDDFEGEDVRGIPPAGTRADIPRREFHRRPSSPVF